MALNPVPCIVGPLAEMATAAQQIENPQAPYPIFYTQPQCGASATGTGLGPNQADFPQYWLPTQCPGSTRAPQKGDNCLVILTSDPFEGSTTLTETQFTSYPAMGAPTDANGTYFQSFYVPPMYDMYIFDRDQWSDSVAMNTIPHKKFYGGWLENALTAHAVPMTDGRLVHTLNHAAVVMVLKQEFLATLIEVCTTNKYVAIGDASGDLRQVWSPQSPPCDDLMTTVCSMDPSALQQLQTTILGESVPLSTVCACFIQQRTLDERFGPSLKVPVCCFGDGGDNPATHCAFNTRAYKTADMARHCCSFAECQQLVDSINATTHNNAPNQVQCKGDLIQLPKLPPPQPGAQARVVVKRSESIPFWVWLIFGIAVILVVAFLVLIAFVVK